jgi:hypothetical protein
LIILDNAREKTGRFLVKIGRFWGKITLKMTQNVPFQSQK